MKLEIYLCDNCKCSINKNEGFYIMKNEFKYLHLCNNCKEEFEKFEEHYKNKLDRLENEYNEVMKHDFPNIYNRKES